MEAKLNFKVSLSVLAIIVILFGFRVVSNSASNDPLLEKAVREVLWSSYSGIQLSAEIEKIREEGDYDKVNALTQKASPDAIFIEQISRSEPLMSASSNQIVIVRVRYRLPGDTSTRTEYMEFKHGSLIDAWSYHYTVSAISYYLNFI